MTHPYVTWRMHTCHDAFISDMTHSYVTWLIHMWYGSFICDMTRSSATWLIHSYHDSFVRDTTHSCIHVWQVRRTEQDRHQQKRASKSTYSWTHSSHSYVTSLLQLCHDSFISFIMWHHSWTCAMTHSSHSYVTWLITCAMTCSSHSYVTSFMNMCHDSFISFIRDMTHANVPWLIAQDRDKEFTPGRRGGHLHSTSNRSAWIPPSR